MTLIDLSVPINDKTPVYPGDPKTKIEPAGQLERDGYNDHYVSIGTHVGTHIDAPMHMLAGGKNLSQIPLEQLVGRGKYIKVDEAFNLAVLEATDIQAGDIVLFHTGMSDQYYDPKYFEAYPAMSVEIAQYLVDKMVKIVGFDTGSADNQEGFPVHKILLQGDVLIIENLTNLQNLEGKSFTVYALPLNVQLDGAPTRVIAQLD